MMASHYIRYPKHEAGGVQSRAHSMVWGRGYCNCIRDCVCVIVKGVSCRHSVIWMLRHNQPALQPLPDPWDVLLS
jgi:hypothetical protein